MNPQDDKIRDLLKKSPRLTPPENFYRGVLQEIERKKNPAKVKAPWLWGYPAKTLASACVIALLVLVSRETKKSEPELSQRKAAVTDKLSVSKDASPAPATVSSMHISHEQLAESKEVQSRVNKSITSYLDHPSPFEEVDEKARQELNSDRAEPKKTIWDENETKISRQSVVSEGAPSKPMAVAESTGDQQQAILKSTVKNTLAIMGSISNKVFPLKKTMPPLQESAGTASTQKNEEWRGATSGIDTPRAVVVRHQKEWETLWQEHAKTMAVPVVDFSRSMVIGVFAGSKPSGGYSVGIGAVRLDSDRITIIYYEMEPEGRREYVAGITRPYVIRIIPANDLPVVFLKAQ